MKTLKSEIFSGRHPEKEIVEFINKNNIQREDILTITQVGASLPYFTTPEKQKPFGFHQRVSIYLKSEIENPKSDI